MHFLNSYTVGSSTRSSLMQELKTPGDYHGVLDLVQAMAINSSWGRILGRDISSGQS